MAEKRTKHFEKIGTDKKLEISERDNRNVQQQLDEAIEILRIYARPDQVGGLANHAIEYLSKWGHS